jgi:hypothetical protein
MKSKSVFYLILFGILIGTGLGMQLLELRGYPFWVWGLLFLSAAANLAGLLYDPGKRS